MQPRVQMLRLKSRLISFRDLLITAGPFLALVLLALGVAYWAVDPAPPRRVVIASGPENSDYDSFAKKYQAIMARHRIQLEQRRTLGSEENLALLRDPASKVDVAFVRSGTTNAEESERAGLVSLGSLFYEPVWVFYRDSVKVDAITSLKGLRVNLGPNGSGTPKLVAQLLTLNGVGMEELTTQRLENTPAVVELLEGKLDALFFTSASDGLLIQMLLRTPGIKLFDFVQAEAYARRLPFLSNVMMPRGVVDLAKDMPPANIRLIAPTSTLVAREGIHPALIELLVQAASEVHGGADWFSRARQFPTSIYTEIPVAREAARFFQSGPPFLQRYLPFWLANLVDRMWVVILSLGALLIPLSRIVPPLYQWRVRSRVYRWYGLLRAIEREATDPTALRTPQWRAELLAQLDEIEEKVEGVTVPLSYTDELYFLRGHIQQVRARVEGRVAVVEAQAAA